MQVTEALSNLSEALTYVSTSLDSLDSLEGGESSLALGADRVRMALREAIVAVNGLPETSADSAEHLTPTQRPRVTVAIGELRGGISAAAIAWRASTARSGEGHLSRVVAATAGVRTILEMVDIQLRFLEHSLRTDGRDLEREWYTG